MNFDTSFLDIPNINEKRKEEIEEKIVWYGGVSLVSEQMYYKNRHLRVFQGNISCRI